MANKKKHKKLPANYYGWGAALQAVGPIMSVASQAMSQSDDEDTQKAGAIVGGVGQVAGMFGGGTGGMGGGAGAQGSTMPQVSTFNYGGNLFQTGGPGDPPKKSIDPKMTGEGQSQTELPQQRQGEMFYGDVTVPQYKQWQERNRDFFDSKFAEDNLDPEKGFDPSNKKQVEAYQKWYNKNSDKPIKVDGKFGEQTATAWIPREVGSIEPKRMSTTPPPLMFGEEERMQYDIETSPLYGVPDGARGNVAINPAEANYLNRIQTQLQNTDPEKNPERYNELKQIQFIHNQGNRMPYRDSASGVDVTQEQLLRSNLERGVDDYRKYLDVPQYQDVNPTWKGFENREELEKAAEEFTKMENEYKANPDKFTPEQLYEMGRLENRIRQASETNKRSSENGKQLKYGGNMFNNGGYGSNNMNPTQVTEFGAGGTHEENKLGGIPQGIGQNGKPNLVEEGELKIEDPRSEEGGFYIISADKSMKITKPLAEKHGLPKKFAGKTVKQVADKILRKDSGREGDTIEENSKKLELTPLLNIHDELTAQKEQEKQEEFQEKVGELEENYPEYMQALMESSTPQQQEQMPPEQAQMPQQGIPQMPQGMEQGMGAPQGMPPMEGMGMPGMRYGGKANSYANGGPGSGFDTSMNFQGTSGLNDNPYNQPWQNNYGLSDGLDYQSDLQMNKSSIPAGMHYFQPLSDEEKQLDEVPTTEIDQSALNAGAQLLPAAYNIGMGLGKDDPIKAGRLSRQELEEMELGQAEIDARQNAAATRRAVRNSGAGQGAYLANMSNVQRNQDSTMARMHSELRNQNAQIGNQQARMDMSREQANIGLSLQEQQMQRQAERERQAMMAAGVSQVGQYAQAQQQDELGAAYANMYSDDYEFKYNKPFSK